MPYLFIGVYLAALLVYYFTESGEAFAPRAVNKILLSSLFLACAAVRFFRMGAGGAEWLALAAVALAALGDALLLWSLLRGGVSFAVANVLLVAYLFVTLRQLGIGFADVWYALPLYALMIGGFFYAWYKKRLDFADMPLFPVYILTVTAHGCLGLVAGLVTGQTKLLLLGCGLFLYAVSDYFLAAFYFGKTAKGNKFVEHTNSGCYFIGMLLTALSLGFAL